MPQIGIRAPRSPAPHRRPRSSSSSTVGWRWVAVGLRAQQRSVGSAQRCPPTTAPAPTQHRGGDNGDKRHPQRRRPHEAAVPGGQRWGGAEQRFPAAPHPPPPPPTAQPLPRRSRRPPSPIALLDDLRPSWQSCAHSTHLTLRCRGGSGRLSASSPPLCHGLAAPQGSPALRRTPGAPHSSIGAWGATGSTQRCRALRGGGSPSQPHRDG